MNTYNVSLLDADQAILEQHSAVQNPFEFDSLSAQIYTIRIERDGALCSQEELMVELFEPSEVQAQFESPDTQNISKGAVQFTNLSKGASSIDWDFGDVTMSNTFNPEHAYADTGIYIVQLVSQENGCVGDFS